MTTHDGFREMLARQRELGIDERLRLQSHLKDCAECRAIADAYDRQGALLRAAAATPPAALRSRVLAAAREPAPPRWTWRRLFPVAPAVTAAALVAVLLAITWEHRPQEGGNGAAGIATPTTASLHTSVPPATTTHTAETRTATASKTKHAKPQTKPKTHRQRSGSHTQPPGPTAPGSGVVALAPVGPVPAPTAVASGAPAGATQANQGGSVAQVVPTPTITIRGKQPTGLGVRRPKATSTASGAPIIVVGAGTRPTSAASQPPSVPGPGGGHGTPPVRPTIAAPYVPSTATPVPVKGTPQPPPTPVIAAPTQGSVTATPSGPVIAVVGATPTPGTNVVPPGSPPPSPSTTP